MLACIFVYGLSVGYGFPSNITIYFLLFYEYVKRNTLTCRGFHIIQGEDLSWQTTRSGNIDLEVSYDFGSDAFLTIFLKGPNMQC